MNILKNILDTTQIDGPYFLRNAVIYTLHDTRQTMNDCPPHFITLETGRKRKSVEMKELSPMSIHSVEICNNSDSPLFLLDGEICCAGYQDRILVTSGLIRKHTSKKVPVACVEMGRSTGRLHIFVTAHWRFPPYALRLQAVFHETMHSQHRLR